MGRAQRRTTTSDSYKQITKRALHGSLASPPTPQHINSRGMVQRAIIAPLLMHGVGGLAPRRGLRERGPQPPAAEPLIPVRRKRKRPALSAQTWGGGERGRGAELAKRRTTSGAGAGWRCGVRLGRHRNEADCFSLPRGAGWGLITPLSPYSPPFSPPSPWGS